MNSHGDFYDYTEEWERDLRHAESRGIRTGVGSERSKLARILTEMRANGNHDHRELKLMDDIAASMGIQVVTRTEYKA